MYKLNETAALSATSKATKLLYTPEIRHRVPISGDRSETAPLDIWGVSLDSVEQAHYYVSIGMGGFAIFTTIVWVSLALINGGTDLQSSRYVAYFVNMKQSWGVSGVGSVRRRTFRCQGATGALACVLL